MQLQKGATFGNYVIGEPIGAGGMGEIYRALDTKLKRDIAIKVLPEAFSRDHDRLERFQREARLLAQLNHTNIATIHGLEEHDAQQVLVMELVEGETLAERIARGPIPIDETIAIFTQIAEGLEAAHDKGIIHRDLKPANVMITPDGHVKILDFGLAKAYQEDPGPTEDASQSPTVTKGTELGVILGTASYMSPEQARGKLVDKRTDLWAFGCCLYEALTGRKAFVGETTTDTLAAIVNAEPDWEKLPAATSSSTRRLLRRCLAKSPRQRLTDAGMARLELEENESGPTAVALPPRHSLAWGLVGVALAAAAITWFVREPRPRELRRLTVEAPRGTTLGEAPGTTSIDVSPDGRFIAFVAFTQSDGNRLYLRAIDEFEPRWIDTGSAGVSNPRFTPDGKWLGYFDENEEILMRFAIEGGSPEAVCRTGDQVGFDWDGGGGIVFTRRNAGLWRCGSEDAEPTLLTSANYEQGEGGHLTPHSLPGGNGILFTVVGPSLGQQLAVLPRGSTEYRMLGVTGYSARYLPTGHIVYAVPGALRAVPFDLARLEVTGDSFQVLDGLKTKPRGAEFAIGSDGTLIFRSGGAIGGQSGSRALLWVDRAGRIEPLTAPLMGYTRFSFSPDGTRVALEVRGERPNVWVWDFERTTITRATFDDAGAGVPRWISNERLVFESHRLPPGNVFEKAADGTGTAELVVASDNHQLPLSVSPDGKWIVFEDRAVGSSNLDLALFSRESGVVVPLLASEFQESGAAISPDGNFIAYHSNESGQSEVYVRTFPNIEDGRWSISSAGGFLPVWSRDGRELFFLDAERRLSVVEVRTSGGFDAGRPTRILEQSFRVFLPGSGATAEARGYAYDVSPDGTRFLTFGEEQEATADPTEIRVVLNWLDELERLAAAVQ